MALVAGSVTISDTGGETKTGFAAVVYNAAKAAWIAKHLTFVPPAPVPTDAKTLVPILRGFADEANKQALIITYLLANGSAGGDPIV